MGNTTGGYAASNNTIYLADTFVATATSEALGAVILEEIGHFVDAQINTVDTPGDEGELFSLLVRGITPGAAELSRIQGENDQTFITIDGQQVVIEQDATITVGSGGDFATLKAAFDAINAGTYTGAITINVISDTTETATASLNASGSGAASYTSILIQPSGGAARTISGAITAGFALIDLNGADNVTINGLNSGGNSLTISNTSPFGNSDTSTIRLLADATNNTITNSTILGSAIMSAATNGGTIYFGAGAISTGNDNNTISNNNIGSAGGNLATKAIYMNGTTTNATLNNSGNTITDNNIFDYFGAGVTSAGVYVGSGNTDNNFTNNKFYQTATRTQTGGNQHSAIWIDNTSSGNNFNISGNTIGFATNTGTGTYTLGTVSGTSFIPIFLAVGTTTATSVQGNTIAGIAMSGSSSGVNTSAPLRGIYVSSGLTTVGDVTGNTIGSQSATGSITYTSTSTGASDIIGIQNAGSSNWIANNNTIGGITAGNSSTGASIIYGIRFSGTTTTAAATLQNNTIGGTVANSLQSTSTATNSQIGGIRFDGSNATITGNTIRNLTAAGGTRTTITASAIGISFTNSSVNNTVSQNTIYSLSNTNALAATTVTGIQYTSGSGTNLISKNFLHSFNAASPAAILNGIQVSGGTATYQNNMIRLGIDSAGNSITVPLVINGINETGGIDNFYFNSVYVGGSGVGTTASSTSAFKSTVTTNTRNIRNNIFVNARSNSTTGGKHYAIQVGGTTANPAGLTINNNLYNVTGNGGVLGFFNSADVASLAGWQTAVGQDGFSFNADPGFLTPNGNSSTVDLHINPSILTLLEGNGFVIGSVTDDFDGQTRSGLTPVDIGADAGNFTGGDFLAPFIAYTPLTNTASTSGQTLIVTITDNTGVPTSGAGLPVLYWKIGAGSYTPATATSLGSNQYQFTFGGGAVIGDTVSYYMVAEDTATTPNVGVFPGVGFGFTSDPPAVSTPPSNPHSYNVLAAIAGTFTVGAGGDYATLAAAVADLNSKLITGAVTFILTDATYDLGTTPLIINNANGGSNATNTVTIKAANAGTTITGSSATAVIVLDGADYVTIDGSSNGTSSRDLTIANTNTVAANTAAIWVKSGGANAGATNNTIKNAIITVGNGGVNANTSYGIALSGATVGSDGADNDNVTIQNNAISGATKDIYAVGTAAISAGGLDNLAILGNDVTSNSSLENKGIQVGNALNSTVSQNTISVTTSASNAPVGISLETGFVSSTVSRNKITNVYDSHTAGYGGRGITVGTGTASSALTIANNIIYGVNGTNWSSFGDSSSMGIGIGMVGGSTTLTTVTGGVNLYNNSVSMTGSMGTQSSAITTALYIGSGASALDIRNNILSNSQTATSTTQKNYAIYSAGANTAFTTINYNDYYVSNSFNAGSAILGFLGSDRSDLAALQTGFGQNANSISANPSFVSTTDLHISPPSPVANIGTLIAAVTTDFDGQTRNATTPDIGADEFLSPTLATNLNALNVYQLNTSLDLTDIVISSQDTPSVTVTATLTLSNTAAGSLTVGSSGAVTSTFNNGVWTATGAIADVNALLAGVTFVPTTNFNGKFTIATSVSDSLGVTVTGSKVIRVPLSGTFTVGTGGDYATLSAAIGDLNAAPIGGAVTFVLTDTNYNLGTTPLVINANAGLNATNTVTIKAANAGTTITGSSTTAVIILNGADYVTIDGSSNGTSSRDLTISNTSTGTSSAVVSLQTTATTDGATNNTIKNLNVVGNSNTTTFIGISLGGTAINTSGTGNNNNTIQNNDISKSKFGIISVGASAANKNQGNIFTQNLMTTAAPNNVAWGGIFLAFENNVQVTQNRIDGVTASVGIDVFGITLGLGNAVNNSLSTSSEVTNATVTGNYIGKVTQTSNFSAFGIGVGSATSGTNIIANNSIYGVGANSANSDFGAGIVVGGGTGSTTKVYYNSVSMTGTFTGGTQPNYGLMIGGSDPVVDVRNNIFYNTITNGTGASYAIGTASSTFANLTSSNNDLFVGTGATFKTGKTGSLATGSGTERAGLSDWQTATGKDANSISVNPLFTSTTDLHLPPSSPVANLGTAIAGVTTDFDGETRNATTPDIGADEILPTATITNVVDDVSPLTGTVTNNGATNDTTPQLEGTLSAVLEAGYVLAVYRNGNKVGNATVVGTNWTYDDSELANGSTYNYTAKVEDSGGSQGTASTAYTITLDTTSPTASITVTDTSLIAGETSLVTFTFSEAVTGFDASDLTVDNGSLSTISTSNNITFTATFTPSTNTTDATNVITLDNTGFADSASNTGTGTTNSNNYAIDTVIKIFGDNNSNEKLIGTNAPDWIDGRGGNDILDGAVGNDTLIGGTGTDTAEYKNATAGTTINLTTGIGLDGQGGTDTLIQIENVNGSNSNDLLTGNDQTNVLDGRSGNDTLNGCGGIDILIGGAGNNALDGGTGIDTADYSRASNGVTVNLFTGTASNNGYGGTDTLTGIEMVYGSKTAGDSLTGNLGNNSLYGYGGADTLTGGGGTDYLYLGVDTVTDTVNYNSGDGSDTVFNFVRGSGGDRLNFTGIANIDVRVSGTSTQFRVGDGTIGNTGFGKGTLLLTTSATTGFVAGDVNVNLFEATFAFS